MIKTLKREPLLALSLIFSFVILILKLIFISTTTLIDDETLYWVWGQHPAMGYIHAPGIALIVRFFTEIFGDTGFGLRLSGVLLYLILACWSYQFGKKWKDERAGLIFATLIFLIPFYFGVSVIITSDMPMLFFLFLSVWYYYKSYLVDKKYFYLAGVLLGMAAMSKTPSILVAISLFLYAFIHPKRKQYLRTKEMWYSFIIAGVIYSPFIIWNFQNDFVFFTYLKGMFAAKKGSLKSFGDLWAAQLGLYLPLTFVLMAIFYVKSLIDYYRHQISEVKFFFAFSSLIPILYLLHKSYVNKLEANWPAFAFVGLVFMLGIIYSENWNKRWSRYSYFGNNLISFVGILLLMGHVWFDILPLPKNIDLTNRYHQFEAIREEFKEYYEEEMDKDVRIISHTYQTPSMINFYVQPKLEAACVDLGDYHPTIYYTLYPDENLRGKDFYYIYHGDTWFPRLFNLFDEVKEIRKFTSYRNSKEIRIFTLYYCRNYQGNDRYVK